jgi:transglutaminase-like putative cysteine protease
MIRALLAGCVLAGLVLGGVLAPAAGVGTPIPDLGAGTGHDGVDPGFDDDDGGSIGGADVVGDGSDADLGVESYGGVSAGGYPRQATVGGRLTMSDQEELRVQSPEPRRWRLGAFATYTGDGWVRNDSRREPLSAPLSTPLAADASPAYEVRVTARRPFRGLVVPWRAAFASVDGRQVLVDREQALTVDGRLGPAESYTAFTYGRTPRDAAAAASGDDPASVEDRYTRLPANTPDRLGERTDEITADAKTPYQAAVAVETWLERTKAYSLNATHDRDADVATQFVLEMAAGYCQYFATAMVAMLRTQGIPARYVTGYSPGEPVGDDEYVVRGRNAHAWVEVYVTEVGWVTFDPTPAEGRVAAGRDARSLATLGDGDDPVAGDEGGDGTDLPTATDEEPHRTTVTLTAAPTPGEPTSAVVTQDDWPVRDTPVTFNGRHVGRTNRGGAVTARVPYAESLTVDVNLAARGSTYRADAAPGPDPDRRTGAATGAAEVRFPLPTEVDVEVVGDRATGGTVEVVATLADEPVPNATVLVDGRAVGTTDDQGASTVSLPEANATGITVRRGAAGGNRTLVLRNPEETTAEAAGDRGRLTVSVAPRVPLALPATPAEVTVAFDGDGVANATVVVDGQRAGTTAADGTLAVGLPLSEPVTVTATVPASGSGAAAGELAPSSERADTDGPATTLTGTATVSGVRRNAAGVLGAVGLFVAVLSGLVRRRRPTARGTVVGLRRRAVGTVRRGVDAIVALADLVDAGGRSVVDRGRHAAELLGEGPEGARRLLRGTAVAVVAAAASLARVVGRRRPGALLAALRGDDDGAFDAGGDGTAVRAAWREFGEYVTVPSWRTSTPGEIARWAVARDGLPEEAVGTLRDAFREVEYGTGVPEERAADVRAAIEEIRDSHGAADAGVGSTDD